MATRTGLTETSPLLAGNHQDVATTTRVTVPASFVNSIDATSHGLEAGAIEDSATSPKPTKTQLYLIIPSIAIGVFLSALDASITISSYGAIGTDLQALNLTSWIVTSYFLPLTSFQPLYGKLSDIFGRKTCLLFAYVVFGLGTLGCGLAGNIYILIAARVLQGIGGGGMTTVVSIIVSDLVSLEERGVWQGLMNIIYAAGSSLGASLGGIISDAFGWRWAFLCQTPVCLIAIVAVSWTLKLPPSENDRDTAAKQTAGHKLRRVDFLGAITLVLAVFALLFGMDRGSNVAWSLPSSYGSLICSFCLLAVFLYIENQVAREPFAPGRIIFDRGMFASYMCYFFSFGAWLAVLFYLPLFYQAVDGYTASEAAIRLLPAIVSSVSGSLFGGLVIKWTGRYYWLTIISYIGLVLGILVIFLFSGFIVNSTWGISIGTVFAAFGTGTGVTTCLIALIANTTAEDQAVATACSYLFRSLGSTVGISINASIIQQVLRHTLERELRSGDGKHGDEKKAAEIEKGVRRSLAYINKLNPEVRAIVRSAYSNAVLHGYAAMMAVSLGALAASIFLKETKLKR